MSELLEGDISNVMVWFESSITQKAVVVCV